MRSVSYTLANIKFKGEAVHHITKTKLNGNHQGYVILLTILCSVPESRKLAIKHRIYSFELLKK